MSEEKTYLSVITTPVGELVYPRLTSPDTRYDPDGVYQTKLLLPFENAQELIAELEGIRDAFIQTLDIKVQKTYTPKPVYEEELDEDGNATGNVLFKFKLKAKVTKGDGETFTQSPVVVMAEDGSAVTDLVYGGTMARLKAQVAPYTMASSKTAGLTLRVRSCQVHELVTGGGDAGAFWSKYD